ncbi:hypothetical protein SNE40_005367 [Patella caerulea]|uniref:J domain-containing protein n=1 Tax=Patella caerulea TaxID=87958 RepID=A0AAN8K0S5_PATCE
MAGMQFEYDEEGGTFYYFLLSFWALVLFPATYYLWPRSKKEDDEEKKKRACMCLPCLVKQKRLKETEPWVKAKQKILKIILLLGWVVFALLAYKVSKVQLDYVEYDPFKELELDRAATTAEIKRAYRKLSLIYHPDKEKTGDPKKFMRIAKAYAALTDEESRNNWKEYGNPDGPGVTRFGIALPKWIVERENSLWVLGVYGLVFMIILPVVVGIWWYRSIKYSGDQVLLDTSRLYWYFINKTPNMILRRAVMILAASFEFDKFHNSEVVERPSDNEQIPALMKMLPHMQEKNKERPLCYPYSVKARALLMAQFQRIDLPPNDQDLDRQYILKKCPYLINEMINICANQVSMAMAGRIHKAPRLDTIENIMKLSQMTIQAVEEKSSPFLQLPHMTNDMLRQLSRGKKPVRCLKDVAMLKEEDRRPLFRSLGDDEYLDIISVIAKMPDVDMTINTEVLDDEDNSVTAGSIVTVTVILKRRPLEDLLKGERTKKSVDETAKDGDEEMEDENGEKEVVEGAESNAPSVWDKRRGKGKKKPNPESRKAQYKERKAKARAAEMEAMNKLQKEKEEQNGPIKQKSPKPKKVVSEAEVEEGEEVEHNSESDEEGNKKSAGDDDDEDWSKFQQQSKKENSLETKIKESHPVHCPYFPTDKHEWWWLYMADRKRHLLITAPVQICSLKTEEEIQLKFCAPNTPGVYQYSVHLRSDSYFVDFDKFVNFKIDVKKAKPVEDHPQWDISDDEDEHDHDDDVDTEDDSDYDSEDDSD